MHAAQSPLGFDLMPKGCATLATGQAEGAAYGSAVPCLKLREMHAGALPQVPLLAASFSRYNGRRLRWESGCMLRQIATSNCAV